jgi:hypothetical protein
MRLLLAADTKRGKPDIDDIRQTDLASDNDDDGSQGSKGSKVTAETNATWTSAMHSMEHSSEPRFSNSGVIVGNSIRLASEVESGDALG